MKLAQLDWPLVRSALRGFASEVPRGERRGFRQKEGGGLRHALVSPVIQACVGVGLAAGLATAAAPAEVSAASPAATHTLDLNYQETDEVLVSRAVGVKLQTAPFPKEPALPGQNVFRGSLSWGPRPEQALPFIWDKGRGRLLLDLNRNRDLTDDPNGLFASVSRNDSQSFTNVHLVLPSVTGNRAIRLQLDFSAYQGGTVGVAAGLCSYWQAQLGLSGKEWQFGLVENLPDGIAPVSPQYLLLKTSLGVTVAGFTFGRTWPGVGGLLQTATGG